MPLYVLLAVLASLCWGVGAVLMKRGVSTRLPKLSISTFLRDFKKILLTLLKSWEWVTSILLGIAGGFAIVQAQSMGDLSVVLPLANLACAFSILFGNLFLKERLSAGEWAGLVVLIAGAVLISISESRVTSEGTNSTMLWLLTIGFTAAVILCLFAQRASGEHSKEFILSICTGLFYGLGYVYLKVTTNMISQRLGTFSVVSWDSVTTAFTIWPAVVVILCNIFGFLCTQLAFSHGRVSVAHPLLTIVANMSPAIGGILVFGEDFTFSRGAGLCAIMAGALVIALAGSNKKGTS